MALTIFVLVTVVINLGFALWLHDVREASAWACSLFGWGIVLLHELRRTP